MTEPVNLNQFRKLAKKTERKRLAAENSVRFGRTKSDKSVDQNEQDKASRRLDMHHLDRDH